MCHHVDESTPAHIHEFYELVYVARGPLLHRYGAQAEVVKTGDVLLVNPHIPHGYELTLAGAAEIWNVMITDEAIRRFARELPLPGPLRILLAREEQSLPRVRLSLDEQAQRTVLGLIAAMDREYREKAPEYGLALRGYLRVLIALTGRALAQAGTVAETPPGWRVVAEVAHRIHSTPADQPVAVRGLAEAMGWSVDYLSRLFKRITGETIQQYICRVQMARAAELIATTDMSLEGVAVKVGYQNARTLRRAFRRVYGVGPSTFRQHPSGGDGTEESELLPVATKLQPEVRVYNEHHCGVL